ncbi:unnamed protein product, partial [Prorocentrum cordatum]
ELEDMVMGLEASPSAMNSPTAPAPPNLSMLTMNQLDNRDVKRIKQNNNNMKCAKQWQRKSMRGRKFSKSRGYLSVTTEEVEVIAVPTPPPPGIFPQTDPYSKAASSASVAEGYEISSTAAASSQGGKVSETQEELKEMRRLTRLRKQQKVKETQEIATLVRDLMALASADECEAVYEDDFRHEGAGAYNDGWDCKAQRDKDMHRGMRLVFEDQAQNAEKLMVDFENGMITQTAFDERLKEPLKVT